jgi:hypothetical protein
MIGNTIKYRKLTWIGSDYTQEEKTGLVVDAYTEITGKSKSESILGFGSGTGKTESKRIYKVQFQYEYSKQIAFEEISHNCLIEIVKFGNIQQTEEKIKDNI